MGVPLFNLWHVPLYNLWRKREKHQSLISMRQSLLRPSFLKKDAKCTRYMKSLKLRKRISRVSRVSSRLQKMISRQKIRTSRTNWLLSAKCYRRIKAKDARQRKSLDRMKRPMPKKNKPSRVIIILDSPGAWNWGIETQSEEVPGPCNIPS